MSMVISKLKVIIMNKETGQPLSQAKVYWDKIPENIRNKNAYCQRHKNSENGLKIDITNSAGFSVLWGEVIYKKQLWLYIHKIECPGFDEALIEKKLSVKGSVEREFTIYLTPNNK